VRDLILKFSVKRLKFDNPVLEKEFIEDYYYKSLMNVRIALILGIVLYSLFGILDVLVAPLSEKKILFIRFAIVTPGLLAVFIISFFNIFRKYMQHILMLITFISGLGIIAMLGIAVEVEAILYYYAGLILILMWAYTLVKLRFIYAVIVCWAIVAGYEITAIFFQDMLTSKELLSRFINNNFFFISSNIIGMFAGYLIELYTRNDFLQRREIAEKSEELQVERNELKDRIKIMDDELDMARLIQEKLIPSAAPGDNIFFLYKPMQAIGGDFFDFLKLSESKIGIFIGDVSGHGVPAALITSIIKSSIHQSKMYYSDPSSMLLHLNHILSTLTEDIFVTAFYGIYDSNDRSIIYSNAGHHSPAVISKNSIAALTKSRSIPLAVMGNTELVETGREFTNSTEIIPLNSKILFYTDGLVDVKCLRQRDVNFGDRFKERLMRLEKFTSKDFAENLYIELIEFRGSESFDDDICIVCVDILQD